LAKGVQGLKHRVHPLGLCCLKFGHRAGSRRLRCQRASRAG
jgi:hypothetical protein